MVMDWFTETYQENKTGWFLDSNNSPQKILPASAK